MAELNENLWTDLNFDDPELQRLLDESSVVVQDRSTTLRADEQCPGFDENAGSTWIYPSNMPCRAYQLSITQASLYRNTLVVLPTGLGKTFIAAVVMYNIYRWYPNGKVIFMAPTRPLVAQQIQACANIMPFPASETVELTGKLQRAKRNELWRTKRIFFATPQVVQSDIMASLGNSSNADDGSLDFPFADIKLVVVDEAHKAKGRYAYTEVVQAIAQRNRLFRVLGLSATPGRTIDDVAEVIRNLCISHLEVRWDNSVDVVSYVHQRSMKTVVVPLGENIKTVVEELLQIVDPYLRQLIDAEVLNGSVRNMNRNYLLFEQKRFRERSLRQQHEHQSAVTTNFAICISLYHALELLERHGLRAFLNNFEEDDAGREKFVLSLDKKLLRLVERLRAQLGPNPFDVSARAMTNGEIAPVPQNLDFGHPKFERARECLLEHFKKSEDTRAIVFCEYRESVMLIYRLLLQHVPLLRPRCFVGQGGTTGSIRALTQKQQLQIMNDFRSGKSNILVATSVGEEGLDVGEVDLIVCFDICTSNPTRFIQRIGRTGRKKHGNVVMLVTEGREQQLLRETLSNKEQTNRKLLRSSVIQTALFKGSPRLVPTELNPKVTHTYIKPPDELPAPTRKTAEVVKKTKKGKGKSVTKEKDNGNKGSQDLRKFFAKLPTDLNDEDMKIFDASVKVPKPLPPVLEMSSQDIRDNGLNTINNYFKKFDHSDIIPRNTQLLSTQKDSRRLRKLTKWLDTTPLMPAAKQTKDLITQLKSTEFSHAGKLLLLKLHPEFLRQICESIKVLDVLDCEQPSMTQDEQDVRQIYDVMLALWDGDSVAVERFLEDVEYQSFKRKCEVECDEEDEGERTTLGTNFEAAMERIFEGLPSPGYSMDNFDYIQQELKKTQRYQHAMAKVNEQPVIAESEVYDTMIDRSFCDDSTTSCNPPSTIIDSKYYSQWQDFENLAPPHKSTPKQTSWENGHPKQPKDIRSLETQQGIVHQHNSNDNVVFVSAQQCSNPSPRPVITLTSPQHQNKDNNATLDDLDEGEFLTNIISKNIHIMHESTPKSKPLQHAEKLLSSVTNIKDISDNNATAAGSWKHIDNFFNIPDDLELTLAFHNLPSAASTQKLPVSQGSTTQELNIPVSELNIDLSDFLDPFPEECHYTEPSKSQCPKENIVNKHLLTPSNAAVACQSPDLFDDTISPLGTSKDKGNVSTILAAKLKGIMDPKLAIGAPMQPVSTTPVLPTVAEQNNVAPLPVTPSSTSSPSASVQKYIGSSPTSRRMTQDNLKQLEKSPSLFDMYLKNMRGRVTLGKSELANTTDVSGRNTSGVVDSPVVPKRRASKRKIFDSDDEEEHMGGQNQFEDDSETDCDEIAPTQLIKPARQAKSKVKATAQQRKRQRRLCDFINDEAVHSGSGSSDEAEDTLNNYMLDSVIVSSAEEECDAASTAHMQAVYLQSLRSPATRRGGFKIPARRIFNDHSQIFSQNELPLSPSQYFPDSFVVEEEDVKSVAEADGTMCPLERAEMILKERRRAKRQLAKLPVTYSKQDKRKKRRVGHSSDDEFS